MDFNAGPNHEIANADIRFSDYLLGVANRITARMVMTPRDRLVCANPRMTVGQAMDLLGASFDQLPVLEGDTFAGLVLRQDLKGKAATDDLGDAIVPSDRVPHVFPDAPMREAAVVLIEKPCVVVLEAGSSRLAGLIHFSDLNRHPVRSNAYLWLSAFEMTLAELLRREVPDPKAWLKVLDEYRQVMILGRWEYDKQQNIEIDPVEAAELSDLLRAVRTLPTLLDRLGFTRSQFDKKTGHLVKLRNGVMHPVRAIIRRHEDVRQLAAAFMDLRELLEAIRRVLATLPMAEPSGPAKE